MNVIEPEISLPLVPPARLGALLLARRKQENVDQATIAERSYGLYDVQDIELLENGRSPLTDETIRAVTELYDLGAGPVMPGRSRLIVDLDMGQIEANGILRALPRAETPAVLERYLSLVYVMRGIDPGNKIPLRREDVEVLAEALNLPSGDIHQQIQGLMTSPNVNRRTRRLSSRLSIPSVGLLIGFTTMGALILAPAAAAEEIVLPEASAQVSEAPEPVDSIAFSIPEDVHQASTTRTVLTGVESTSTADESDAAAVEVSSPPTTVDVPVETSAPETSVAEPQTTTEQQIETTTSEAPAAEPAAAVPLVPTTESTTPTTAPTTQPSAPQTTLPPETQAIQTTQAPTTAAPTTAAPTTAAPTPAPVAATSSSQIGQRAEALIPFDFEAKLPGWKINYEGDRSGYLGMTNRVEKTVTIYVRSGDTPAQVAEVLSHELGHALDLELLTNDQRLQWLEARGMPQVWWVDNGHSDFEAGQGDFAEAVASLWVASPSNSHHGNFTPEQLALAASFIQ